MTGERLGQWILGASLGRGAVGEVFRAESATDLGASAAVKVFDHPLTRAPEFLARFPAAFLSLKRVGHPNLVAYFDAGVVTGKAWYACELVNGTDLGTLLKSRRAGLAPAEDGLRVAAQLARGLKHGHNRQLLHGGLRPTSVFVTPEGVVKLGDFGLAKLLPLTPGDWPADPWGVLGCLAPEVFQGKPPTRKSDLYALGGVYYALFTGRPMVQGAGLAEFVRKHCYALPDRPAAFTPTLPLELDELICDLIQKDPARRPAAAPLVTAELEAARGKLERKGQKVAWPADAGDESGPLAALSPDAERAAESARPRPLMARPAVVLPLFALVAAVILGLILRPRPSAGDLIAGARSAMRSTDPAAWERAEGDYLAPLRERFPEAHAAEAREIGTTLRERQALRRTLAALATPRRKPESPAEALYHRGLKLAEAGDAGGARRLWSAATLVERLPGESGWGELARAGLAGLDRVEPVGPDPTPLRAFARDDPAARAALREAFRDDPAALTALDVAAQLP